MPGIGICMNIGSESSGGVSGVGWGVLYIGNGFRVNL